MSDELFNELAGIETDLDGALYRVAGDKNVYLALLKAFASDTTMGDLDEAIVRQSWDDAFTAAHALKGLAGNMGFAPLFHSLGELLKMIRSCRISEIDSSYKGVKRCYDEIMMILSNHN